MQYTFEYHKMTVADTISLALAAKTGDLWTGMLIIDRLTVGGIMHLPMKDLGEICQQFAAGYVEYLDAQKANEATARVNTDNINRLINQALGKSDAQ
jgi:hypothetical protein